MSDKDLEKKMIKDAVKMRIGKGEPKQKILEDLSMKYKDIITIVRQLEKTPSIERKRKYLPQNIILSFLLLTALGIDTITLIQLDRNVINIILGFSILNVVLDVIFLYGVKTFKIEVYSWIASRAVVTLIMIVISYAYYYQAVHYLVYVSLGLVTCSLIFGLYLSTQLCPRRIPTYKEVSVDGQEKVVKRIFIFPD